MRPWLRRTLLVSGVFVLCWCGAVIYWQGSKHMPTSFDLAGVMLALPLLLLTGLWLGQKLVAGAPAPEPAAAAPLDSIAAAAPAPAAPLFIAASALHMLGAESGPQLAAVTQVCADSDQRSSRMIELMNSAGTLLPGLDLSLDVLGVAAACGESGHVAALAALVLAHHEAADNAGQVLCISNLDPFQRGAVVVAPAA